MPFSSASHGVTATIDLDAVAANYRQLQDVAGNAEVAGVVKADGYGLGAVPVARTLEGLGCTSFYVALYDEALALRAALPGAAIAVLGGLPPGAEADALSRGITPVINDLGALERLRTTARQRNLSPGFILHVDTGMNRLGLDARDWARFQQSPDLARGLTLTHVMSHLACSDEWNHPMNAEQRDRFAAIARSIAAAFPHAKTSFANSCGILLGKNYHFDQCRAGRALYGTDLAQAYQTTLRSAVSLHAPILMVRYIDSDGTVGYSAAQHARKGMRLATLSAGYADGLLRSLSSSDLRPGAHFYLNDYKVPLVGRVSMDLIVVDVSHVPETLAHPGAQVEIAGPHQSIDALAASAGTIGYELLTRIAPRVKRNYVLNRNVQAA